MHIDFYNIIQGYISSSNKNSVLILNDPYYSFNPTHENILIKDVIKNIKNKNNIKIVESIDEYFEIADNYELIINIFFSAIFFNQLKFYNQILKISVLESRLINILPYSGFINYSYVNFNPIFIDFININKNFEINEIAFLDKYGKKYHKSTGLAIQSYLHRSIDDINNLASENFNARICKGIYKESEKLAFQNSSKIRNNFLALAEIMALKNAYACYATHDQKLIDQILRFINKYQLSKDRFEFQVLYGVPMEGRLESLIGMGYKVRVYIPYGPDWFDYSIRRLKENPKIINFVFKNFLAKKVNPNKN